MKSMLSAVFCSGSVSSGMNTSEIARSCSKICPGIPAGRTVRRRKKLPYANNQRKWTGSRTYGLSDGPRVELLNMDDLQAPPVGTQGTVYGVDDTGSLLVHWDNGSSLSVVFDGGDMVRNVGNIHEWANL